MRLRQTACQWAPPEFCKDTHKVQPGKNPGGTRRQALEASRMTQRTRLTCLADTQEHAADGQLAPIFDKAHSEHDGTPCDRDGGKEVAWTDASNDEVRGNLEELGSAGRQPCLAVIRLRWACALSVALTMYGTKKMQVMMLWRGRLARQRAGANATDHVRVSLAHGQLEVNSHANRACNRDVAAADFVVRFWLRRS